MKLQEFQRRIRGDKHLKDARAKLRGDIAFQIGHLLEGLRLSLGLSQSQFARKVRMQQPAIARMERGTIVPSLPVLQSIADSLNLRLVLPYFTSKNLFVGADSPTGNTKDLSYLSPYFSKDRTRTGNITKVLA